MSLRQHAQPMTSAPIAGKRPLVQPGAPKAKPEPTTPEREELLLKRAAKPKGAGLFGMLGFAIGGPKIKPDFSEEGFARAARAAITFAAGYSYNSADDMHEELEHLIGDALRISGGVHVKWTASDKLTKHPRLVIKSDWGWRIALDTQLSFDPVRLLNRVP